MVDSWIVDWTRNERLPYYTRANAGEVLPDPASPLGWSLVFEEGLLPGWYRGFVEFGIYGPDEFNTPPKIPMVGIFGGYFYLNLSHMRLLGLRLGADLDEFDAGLLGSHPDTPPYEPHPDDVNPELSAKAAATIGEILGSTSYPLIDEDRRRTARFAAERPDLTTLTDAELVARARWFAPELDNGFARHDYSSLASTIGPSILAGLCASIGEPDLQLELISGLGDVDSASPSWGLWALSREANASPEITALFDEGPDAVLAAITDPQTDATRRYAESFAAFMRESGSRGPNEWDIHALSWEADPLAPLKLVNGIRKASDADSPQARHERLAARRAAAADRLRAGLAGNEEALGTLEMALASTSLSVPARERTKATCVAVVNEVRMADPRARPPRRRAGPVRQARGRHDADERRARRVRGRSGARSATSSPRGSPTTRSCSSSIRRSSSPRIRHRCRSGRAAPSAACRCSRTATSSPDSAAARAASPAGSASSPIRPTWPGSSPATSSWRRSRMPPGRPCSSSPGRSSSTSGP